MKKITLPFMHEIMANVLVNSMNYDTPAINAEILLPWSSYKKFSDLTYHDVTRNIQDDLLSRGLSKGVLIENHFFNQFLENIQNFYEEKDIPRKKVLEEYIAGFGSFSRKKLQGGSQFEILTKFTGKSLEALSFLPEDFSFLTTPFKDIHVVRPEYLLNEEKQKYDLDLLENDINSFKKIKLEVSPIIQGLKTTEANFYFFFGSLREILKSSSDTIFDYTTKYNSATGKGEITAFYQEESRPFLPQRAQLLKYLFPKILRNKKKAKNIVSTLEEKVQFATNLVYEKNDEIFKRDISTGYHVNGMSLVLKCMLDVIGASDQIKRDCILGGHLHDIGKNGTPNCVLRKTTKFSPLERKIMDSHGPLGTFMVNNSNLGAKKLKISGDNVVALTFMHHLPLNGQNYYGFDINTSKIPLFARFSLVADIFHGLLEQRVYKEAQPIDNVLENLNNWFPEGFFDPIALEVLRDYVVPFFKRELRKDNFSAEDINKILRSKFNGNIDFANKIRALSNGNLSQREELELFADNKKAEIRLLELRNKSKKLPINAFSKKTSTVYARGYFRGYLQDLHYLDLWGHLIENKSLLEKAPSSLQEFTQENKFKRNSPNLDSLEKEDFNYLDSLGFKEDPLIEETINSLIKHSGEKELESLLLEKIY